ncbi:hypothetical protein HYT45_01820 [Candidatus Uhrbacteria bacterium]|nr:hypothetical protein [Candidatus Uhrbacteria bacterium]
MRLLAKLGLPLLAVMTVIIANLLFWHQAAIGIPFLAGYALIIGFSLGRKLFPRDGAGTQTFLGVLLLIAVWSVLGALIFYFGKFGVGEIILTLALPALLLPGAKSEPRINPFPPSKMSLLTLSAGAGFLLLEFASFFILARSATSAALRSPWERVPPEFFLIFFLASLALLILCSEHRLGLGRVVLISAHTALIASVALIVFEIGFGFDPFIHRATENYILGHGTITPKHLYYAGEYGLIVFLSRGLAVPTDILNKLLVPMLAAVSLPYLTLWAFFTRLREQASVRVLAPLAPFFLLIFPFSPFISTTPQSLANLFLFFAVLLGFSGSSNSRGFAVPAIAVFTVASLLAHPIGGIPAAIFLALFLISKIKRGRIRWPLLIAAAVSSSAIIPLTFMALNALGGSGGEFAPGKSSLEHLFELIRKSVGIIPFRYNFFLDMTYLYGWNKGLWLILAAFAGYLMLKRKSKEASNAPFILASFAVFVNSILTASIISFPALPDYEQAVYSSRLAEISVLLLLPLAISGALWFYNRAREQRHTFVFAFLLFPALITAALYLAYPRTDKYESTHGYNTSIADIHAVEEIEKDACEAAPSSTPRSLRLEESKVEGCPKYIVLSNQAVGAAALQEFGFINFYETPKGKIYFYSVPTGGPLYPYYLKMVYEAPSREIMKEAMNLAGVKLGYIAINHYWTNARALTEKLSEIADKEIVVDGGRVYVYRFRK